MLADAWNSLPGIRNAGRISDEDYVTLGRRSNSDEMAAADIAGFVDLLRDGESLDDLLDVPFSLARARDLHAVMQLALAGVGDSRDELTRRPHFYPVFTAFVLGMSMGMTFAHRATIGNTKANVKHLSKPSRELCESWAVSIAVFYLARVEAQGIVDHETDQAIYGVQNQWRLIADERRLDAFAQLPEVVAAGTATGEQWVNDESIDVGIALEAMLERVVSANPDRTFQ